jgi:drug/metabolite transporter (DMT)-like permease
MRIWQGALMLMLCLSWGFNQIAVKLVLPDVPPEQLLASVLMYRVIYEIIPLLVALALWGSYETFGLDGVRLRLMRPRHRPSPPGDP